MGFLEFDENGHVKNPELSKGIEKYSGDILEILKLLSENEEDVSDRIKEKISKSSEKYLTDLWEETHFNCESYFNNMIFLGGITGRRNRYYLYKNNNILLLSSGFSEDKPTRTNIFFSEEIEFLDIFIKDIYKKMDVIGSSIFWIIESIKKNYEDIPCELNRLRLIVDLNRKKLDENNLLYSFILGIFYILTIMKDYKINMEHRKFILKIEKSQKENLPDIYRQSHLVGFDRWRIIFGRNNYYYVASFKKPFRGIFYIYDKREIEQINNMINNSKFLFEDIWKDRIEINTNELLREINKSQNNICLVCFREIMARNVRNDREEFQYTDSRLKLALKIIKIINGGILIEKDGRKNRYFKRKYA